MRSVFCAPLREHMAHFKIFYAARQAHSYPTAQLFKAECVSAVFAVYVYKLKAYGTPAAYIRIKRQIKQRSQDHIDAVVHSGFNVFFNHRPKFFAVILKAVIALNAIGIKPLSAKQLLMRQNRIHNIYFHYRRKYRRIR